MVIYDFYVFKFPSHTRNLYIEKLQTTDAA